MSWKYIFLLWVVAAIHISHASAAETDVGTVAALRAGNFDSDQGVLVEGYRQAGDGGGGYFWLNSADSQTKDNGCTVIVDAAGHRFYRGNFAGSLNVAMCGVRGDGITDDTVATQSAINVVCHGPGQGGTISIPPSFTLLITAPLSFKGCTGLRFGGTAVAGGDTYRSATIMWGGPPGSQPVLSVDQAAASSFENLTIYTYDANLYARDRSAPSTDVAIDDTEAGPSIVQTNTDNRFSSISIFGPPKGSPNFVGIRIGFGDLVGNVDIASFYRVSVICSQLPNVSATSSGAGIRFDKGDAEPFATQLFQTELLNCSAGFDLEGQINNLVLDGGVSENNYSDLLVNSSARGLVFRNFRSEYATNAIVVNHGDDITIDHVSLSAVRNVGINVQGGGEVVIDTLEFEDSPGRSLVPNGVGSVFTVIRNSVFPNGQCPTLQGWKGNLSSRGNLQRGGPSCTNYEAIGQDGRYALAVAGAVTVSSPTSQICGLYQILPSNPQAVAQDCWNERDVVGVGANGTSVLQFSHVGTPSSSSIQVPSLSLSQLLMSASVPKIASGFSRDPAVITANGTAAFSIVIGKQPENSGVINLPEAEHGWICQAQDITTQSRAVFQTTQTGTTRTSCTLTQFDSEMTPSNWMSSDVLAIHALAY